MQLSPRLAARPLRLLPPLASATSGPRRHSVVYLIKPPSPAPPRLHPLVPPAPPSPPRTAPSPAPKPVGYSRTVDGEVCRRRRLTSKPPNARILQVAQVSVTFRRQASQRSEDSVSPRVPLRQPLVKVRVFPTTQTVSVSGFLETRPTPRWPCPSSRSLPTILTVQTFGSFRRFPALAHDPSRD